MASLSTFSASSAPNLHYEAFRIDTTVIDLPPASPKSRAAWSALSSLGELISPKSTNRADFLSECRSGALDGVKAAYRTFGSVEITGRIEGEVVEALAKAGLKFLAHNGALRILALRSSFVLGVEISGALSGA